MRLPCNQPPDPINVRTLHVGRGMGRVEVRTYEGYYEHLGDARYSRIYEQDVSDRVVSDTSEPHRLQAILQEQLNSAAYMIWPGLNRAGIFEVRDEASAIATALLAARKDGIEVTELRLALVEGHMPYEELMGLRNTGMSKENAMSQLPSVQALGMLGFEVIEALRGANGEVLELRAYLNPLRALVDRMR